MSFTVNIQVTKCICLYQTRSSLNLKEYYLTSRREWDILGETGDRIQNEHFFAFFNKVGNSFYPESPYLWFRGFLKNIASVCSC
ncbi:hypothetical protein SAMN05443246_1940 [Paenibacillus sp. GP183]|nr:hypothetical protein SAMN05443246_1940 [Paenibacillus sp. GP183]